MKCVPPSFKNLWFLFTIGFLISVICTEERNAIQMALGSFYPNLLLSGNSHLEFLNLFFACFDLAFNFEISSICRSGLATRKYSSTFKRNSSFPTPNNGLWSNALHFLSFLDSASSKSLARICLLISLECCILGLCLTAGTFTETLIVEWFVTVTQLDRQVLKERY